MPITSKRTITPEAVRNFGRFGDTIDVPSLTEIQTKSYDRFIQLDVHPEKRDYSGLEGLLREIFPIKSYDKTIRLQYLRYELGKPRFGPDECRQLRLTYGRPLKVWLRLEKEQPVEEEVFLCEMPIMIGGGEFIINGEERIVVSQLYRSPGVDFQKTINGDKELHSCRIIPERGSWIEINVTTKDALRVKIDQSRTFSAMTLLRAMDPNYSTDADIIKEFYETEVVKMTAAGKARLKYAQVVGDVIDPETDEIYADSGEILTEEKVHAISLTSVKEVIILKAAKDPIIMASLRDDATNTHEEALLKIYAKLRPGKRPQLQKAKEFFKQKFLDPSGYHLGKVGRFRLNRKFDQEIQESEMTLRAIDLLNAIKYLLKLRAREGYADDIDHLGNRRVRTIDELATDELRKGFLKLKRTVQERMSMHMREQANITPRQLINSKSISAAVEYFFGRGEFSQVVDQTNPLSQLTHERRISALGPGGLIGKRAGLDVRDVHTSHYGRICPIETPEGINVGLISHLSIYAGVDDYGFLITPYRAIKKRKLTTEVKWLRADEEALANLAPADAPSDGQKIMEERVIARHEGNFKEVGADDIEYIDISPMQMVGVSAGLIPFLEHDVTTRALMGCKMQRQAVPLLITEAPLVATGLEKDVAYNSGMVLKSPLDGYITYVDSDHIIVGHHKLADTGEGSVLDRARAQSGYCELILRKFVGLNEHTCQNHRPLIKFGQKVKKGTVLADGAATSQGELALGRNLLVAFMSWEGYNFDDAIIISEKLVHNDTFTSIHIQHFEIEIRETKYGKEEFTRDIPNVSPKALANLDENGVVRIGTYVQPGDILVGKVCPKSKDRLTPEEIILYGIFGRASEDVKNDSLEVPSDIEGVVTETKRFCRKSNMTEEEKNKIAKESRDLESHYNKIIIEEFRSMLAELGSVLDKNLVKDFAAKSSTAKDEKALLDLAQHFTMDRLDIRTPERKKDCVEVYGRHREHLNTLFDEKDRKLNILEIGEELPPGVLQMVKVYVAAKRRISVGDKMAGRHGNKGVISKILPVEDMPYLADGTPVDILLNPLGVPSRMNVGQILETHLGWAASKLGFKAITPVFDGATEEEIRDVLKECGLPVSGKSYLFDGRTGERFEQAVTVGYIYMLKLNHLVDDKVHARATGPYSLITQQPLGGKARFGGQRFGEMEVWALEAYGAAYILQELLTVKSDDVEGRTRIYESIVRGENTLEAGIPASFDVLTNEIRGLALNMQLGKKRL